MDENQKLLNLNVFVVVLEDFSFGHPGMLLSTGQTEKGTPGNFVQNCQNKNTKIITLWEANMAKEYTHC